MGKIVLAGSIIAGPSTGSANVVPSSVTTISLFFANGSKSSAATTGSISRTLNSPNAFQALGGIGANEDVTKADFFYINAASPIDIEITADDGAGGSTVQVVSCSGPQLFSPSAVKMITGVRLKGSGAIEYFASGPQ
jgi:hypothetical protein